MATAWSAPAAHQGPVFGEDGRGAARGRVDVRQLLDGELLEPLDRAALDPRVLQARVIREVEVPHEGRGAEAFDVQRAVAVVQLGRRAERAARPDQDRALEALRGIALGPGGVVQPQHLRGDLGQARRGAALDARVLDRVAAHVQGRVDRGRDHEPPACK